MTEELELILMVIATFFVIGAFVTILVKSDKKRSDKEIEERKQREIKERDADYRMSPIYYKDGCNPYDRVDFAKISKFKDLELLFAYLGIKFDIHPAFVNPFYISISVPESLKMAGTYYTSGQIFNEFKYQYEKFLFHGISNQDIKQLHYTVYVRKGDNIETSLTHRLVEFMYNKNYCDRNEDFEYVRII